MSSKIRAVQFRYPTFWTDSGRLQSGWPLDGIVIVNYL